MTTTEHPADVAEQDRPAALLTAFLADRDVPCPQCGYNLRALSGDRCPECGDVLRLQVGLTSPRDPQYLTLMAAAYAGLAGSGMFTLFALRAAPPSWWRREVGAQLLLAELLGTAIMFIVALRSRRRFRRLPPDRQWRWAVAAWVAVIAVSGIVIYFCDS